jgi:Helix-turn-helix domain
VNRERRSLKKVTSSNLYIITDFFSQKGRKKVIQQKKKFLTAEETATLLRQKPRTITAWANMYQETGGGEGLPGIKLGRRWLFDEAVILEMIEKRSTRSA